MEIRREMEDFMFCAPTQLFFGRTALDNLEESINIWSPNKRVLVVYGGGSIKKIDVYKRQGDHDKPAIKPFYFPILVSLCILCHKFILLIRIFICDDKHYQE